MPASVTKDFGRALDYAWNTLGISSEANPSRADKDVRFRVPAILTSCINAVRKGIGDSGEEQGLLRTISRKGYRFVSEVTVVDSPAAADVPPNHMKSLEAGANKLNPTQQTVDCSITLSEPQ